MLGRLAALVVAVAACSAPSASEHAPGWRGVFFNPQVAPDPNYPWLLHYDDHRPSVRAALADVRAVGLNLVDVHVMIPHSLRTPGPGVPATHPRGNRDGEAIEEWANLRFLDNVARFVDDCHAAGLQAELDLVDNRWIPHTVDPEAHIGKPGNPWWPVADQDPWTEAAAWYRQMIEGVEARVTHPEAIAMWCMLGNYRWGAAEPVLWDDAVRPDMIAHTRDFVKHVWPEFRRAGRRPKAAPILLPIFAAGGYWRDRTPDDRLSAFANLKRWLVTDLGLAPDYWVMSAYPDCDPAPDGFRYLRRIVEILGRTDAHRILATDLKAEGHDEETRDTILSRKGRTGADMMRWHVAQCRRYGFAGWWVWAYMDTPTSHTGLRRLDGSWKRDLLEAAGLNPPK
jgi:hypothetical protein